MHQSSDISLYQTVTILNTGHIHEVLATTPKSICIAISDGRWGGDGAKQFWVPRSLITVINYKPNPENPTFGIFEIELPLWFIQENKKKLV